jgi:flagellar hook-associated protein 1 FlgK
MSTSLSIASTQIGNINAQFGVISQNVANASTPDYAVEDVSQNSVTAGGVGMGAVNTAVGRAINTQVQAEVFGQNSTVAALQTQQSALQQIDSVEGAVGGGSDIGSLLGAMQDAFSTLQTQPNDPTQQQQVVRSAQALTGQINTLANTVGATRQAVQDGIITGIAQLNASLATLGALSDQIVSAQAQGQSTAGLANQRDAAEDSLSHLIAVTFSVQPNGDLLAVTPSGINLPIHATTPPFATAAATVGPTVYAPGGGLPPVTFDGQDVTARLTGGQLGANITLRDQTLPGLQANLDEFSETLSTRFDAQGLTLFTDGTAAVPTTDGPPVQTCYIGYANTIQVNPAVIKNPVLVVDGTHAVTAGAGGASAFTPNPASGPVGFTGMITRVLDYALGANARAGVAQAAPAVSGLGPAGNLSAGFSAPADLAAQAASVTGAEAQQSAAVTSQLGTEQAVQTGLQATLSAGSSVSIDSQMSLMIVLQNAYGANAKVISAVQSMFTQLLQSMPG